MQPLPRGARFVRRAGRVAFRPFRQRESVRCRAQSLARDRKQADIIASRVHWLQPIKSGRRRAQFLDDDSV